MAMTKIQLTAAEAAYAKNPDIGRRKLIAACGCTGYSAAQFLRAKHAGRAAPAAATGDPSGRAAPAAVAGNPSGRDVRSFTLKPDSRVTDRRPVATVRSRFYGLVKGRAYPVAELARDWGVSAETLRRHALDAECFKYVDTTGHDDWEACVMHPDTAAAYNNGK